MDALQNNPANKEIQDGTLEAIAINLSEHRRIVEFTREVLETCETVPDGLLSTLALLAEDMKANVNQLCELKTSPAV